MYVYLCYRIYASCNQVDLIICAIGISSPRSVKDDKEKDKSGSSKLQPNIYGNGNISNTYRIALQTISDYIIDLLDYDSFYFDFTVRISNAARCSKMQDSSSYFMGL